MPAAERNAAIIGLAVTAATLAAGGKGGRGRGSAPRQRPASGRYRSGAVRVKQSGGGLKSSPRGKVGNSSKIKSRSINTDSGVSSVSNKFLESGKKELNNFLKENKGENLDVIKNRLNRAIRKHQKGIEEHKNYLKNPRTKYKDKWDTMSEQHKQNAIHHWREDIKRAEAYLKVKLDYLKGL